MSYDSDRLAKFDWLVEHGFPGAAWMNHGSFVRRLLITEKRATTLYRQRSESYQKTINEDWWHLHYDDLKAAIERMRDQRDALIHVVELVRKAAVLPDPEHPAEKSIDDVWDVFYGSKQDYREAERARVSIEVEALREAAEAIMLDHICCAKDSKKRDQHPDCQVWDRARCELLERAGRIERSHGIERSS